jgi:hypothetical protein
MTEAERLAQEVIARYEEPGERQKMVDDLTRRIKSGFPGGWITRKQANYYLGLLTGRNYFTREGQISPLYKAIERGLVATEERAGDVAVDVNSFISWLAQFQPRTQGESDE